jgi:23S rRNA (cytidine1920-2'-O)/16S rRNA (cytidine1409-2'-O)-methyltransferase
MRLDQYLVEQGMVPTRSRAQLLIKDGAVSVNGTPAQKPSLSITSTDQVLVRDSIKYVSRAGLKLEHALKLFDIDPTGLSCLDVGSSTGGFTDCLLQRNAARIDCVDVGTDQLSSKLRTDKRVSVFEQTDIRRFDSTTTYNLIVCDASFISLAKLAQSFRKFSHLGTQLIVLIKPQFEVGKGNLNRQGIVTDPTIRNDATEAAVQAIIDEGFNLEQPIQSSAITGGDGNIEYVAYFLKTN